MTVGDLFQSIRYRLDDFSKLKTSDFDLCDTYNTVLNAIFNALTKQNTDLITKTATLTLTAGSSALPTDYAGMVDVTDANDVSLGYAHKGIVLDANTYRIYGTTLYSTNTSLTLTYMYRPSPTVAKDDTTLATAVAATIPLPDYFSDLIQNYVVMITTGQLSKLDAGINQLISADVYKIANGNTFNSLEMVPSWTV